MLPKSMAINPTRAEMLMRRCRYQAIQWLGTYPSLFFPALRLLGNPRRHSLAVSSSTQLVIEGFPRSANTFAVVAFQMAQPSPIQIAHHLHVPAQIIRAVQHGIPTLVLIRKPDEAALSLVIRIPYLPLSVSLYNYWHFYKKILPFARGYLVASFEEVTTDFGSVICRLNQRFGKDFVPFVHNEENVKRCFERIETLDATFRGTGRYEENTVSRPSTYRKKQKTQKRNALSEEETHTWLVKAYEIYDQFLSEAGRNSTEKVTYERR